MITTSPFSSVVRLVPAGMGAISAATGRLGRDTRRPRFVSPFLISPRKVRNRGQGRKKLPVRGWPFHFLILIILLILIPFFQFVIELD